MNETPKEGTVKLFDLLKDGSLKALMKFINGEWELITLIRQ